MAGKRSSAMEAHRISSAPESMFYIPNFISEHEEAHILNKVHQRTPLSSNAPTSKLSPKQIFSNRWVNLTHRRLQAVPARLTATNTLLSSSSLPDYLTSPIIDRFNDLRIFAGAPHGVNHCLVNEYLPGQGIMPHEDGAAYYPVVATVSLRGTVVLDISEKARGEDGAEGQPRSWRILQEPRSLLVTTGSAYTNALHGIADVHEDLNLDAETVANWRLLGDPKPFTANGGRNERTTRISLTYRDVKKVSTIGSKIFGRSKS